MSVDSYYKKNMAAFDESMKKSIADSDAIFANQKQNVTNTYNSSIELSKQQYDEDLRANEVQKYINKREVAENNANLGLTDSGLNRTQMTAVQLSASNNAAKIERDRTNMVNALTIEMNTKLAEIENDRISAEASIRSGYEKQAMDAAVKSYEADVDAAQKANDLIIETQEKYNAQMKTDYSNLYKHLSENSADKDYCAKLIDEYATLYDIDENGSEMTALLKAAELDLQDVTRYSHKGTIYYSQAEYAAGDKGKVKAWDYETAGAQDYIIELVDSTWNWGGFFNTIKTVDGDDKVNIYYPDGTPLATNVKLKNLPTPAAQTITDWTAKAKEKEKTTLNINLAGARLS